MLWNHDFEDKQFSAFYNNKTITGQGEEELTELLDMIFENEEVSLYICRRLYNFFVYHDIDEATEANVIVPLARLFRENNYDITVVLKTLFKSEHFFDAANYGATIKNPVDQFLGFIRVMDNPRPSNINERLYANLDLLWPMASMGMEIGDPPSVSGWQAYYQAPSFDKLWINTETIIRRIQYQQYLMWESDLTVFIGSLANPRDPNEMIRESAMLLMGITLEDEIIDGLKSLLLAGQGTDDYWTIAWDQHVNNPDNSNYQATVQIRLASMFRSMIQYGEFQLM